MITAKQEAFAQAIADGMNQSEAYRSARKVGSQTKPETVHKRASALMVDGQVARRVAFEDGGCKPSCRLTFLHFFLDLPVYVLPDFFRAPQLGL